MQNSILIADDDRVSRTLYARILQQAGYLIHEAKTGKEALQMARSVSPHLLLLDIGLPDIDGLTVCRLVRSDTATSHMPVFMMSAQGGNSIQARVHAYGATAFLQKPIRRPLLLEHIQRVLTPRMNVSGRHANYLSM